MTSSIYPITLTAGTAGTLISVAVVSGGTGYEETGETVTITGQTSGSSDATGTVTVTAGVIQTVTVVLPGTKYITGETVTLTGLTSGANNATGTATATIISLSTDILSSDITITNDQVKPGGGGVVRLAFAFTLAVTPATFTVFNNSAIKGTLNADNSGNIISDGYYRFDIDVEAGDNLNLQADQNINVIRFVRAHLVQFGA